MFWIGTGIGIIIGSIVTIFAMALCMTAGRGDNNEDN